MKNIVLIGLPGSGKTTLGKFLAEKLKVEFYDSDVLVEQESGQTIPELFDQGEQVFRDWESRVLTDVAKLQGAVIATGGGAVLREGNMLALKQNGLVVFINRSPEQIQKDLEGTEGRPLLDGDKKKIYELHQQRLPLYEKYQDYTVSDVEWQRLCDRVLALGKEILQ